MNEAIIAQQIEALREMRDERRAEVARYRAALEQIADMDPAGLRADDLSRAARIAARALKGE